MQGKGWDVISQIWSKVGKLLGGLLLVGGGTVSAGILVGIGVGHPGGALLTVLLTLMVFFGLAPASLGGLLLYTGFKAEHHALRDRFFQLLQANRGRLSLLDFVAVTRLEPAIARRHLDIWAKEFFADFEVTDSGEIYYVFTAVPLPPENQRLQIIGQAVREVLRAL